MCEHCNKEDFLDIVAGNHSLVSSYKYTIDETKFDYKINFEDGSYQISVIGPYENYRQPIAWCPFCKSTLKH